MSRLLISLDEPERLWLERHSAALGISMAEVVRQAIRQQQRAAQASLDDLLAATNGVWKHGDGLAYQQQQREDW
jgi:hypothetical protein